MAARDWGLGRHVEIKSSFFSTHYGLRGPKGQLLSSRALVASGQSAYTSRHDFDWRGKQCLVAAL